MKTNKLIKPESLTS